MHTIFRWKIRISKSFYSATLNFQVILSQSFNIMSMPLCLTTTGVPTLQSVIQAYLSPTFRKMIGINLLGSKTLCAGKALLTKLHVATHDALVCSSHLPWDGNNLLGNTITLCFQIYTLQIYSFEGISSQYVIRIIFINSYSQRTPFCILFSIIQGHFFLKLKKPDHNIIFLNEKSHVTPIASGKPFDAACASNIQEKPNAMSQFAACF